MSQPKKLGGAPKSAYKDPDTAFGMTGTGYRRCYHDHPPMPLPGSDKVVYGGSCGKPVVEDADIYVGLDGSMKRTDRRFPWEAGDEVYYPITDMEPPKDPPAFRKLVDWLKEQIDAGRKVHIGCIGGHGRTGTVLSALVSLYGEPDAIAYVRKHYCVKAVESHRQVAFLGSYFGVLPQLGHKESAHKPKAKPKTPDKGPFVKDLIGQEAGSPARANEQAPPPKPKPTGRAARLYKALPGCGSIWGR